MNDHTVYPTKTVNQYATFVGIKRAAVYKRIASGKVRSVRCPHCHHPIIVLKANVS